MSSSTSHELHKSRAAMEEALRWIPGGVNSPVRAFGAVGGTPPFVASAKGCRLRDVDGHEYIDFVGSWGPMIAGHAHPHVVEAVREAALKGTSFGAPTTGETELARRVVERVPGMERLRLVNSGTEATMSALRVARGVTGRSRMVKFNGCYHGHGDAFLVQAGSGAATFGVPNSPGVPAEITAATLSIPFNDVGAAETVFKEMGSEIAAVIVEPVAGNMGLVPPEPGFLEGLVSLCTGHGALLILDEVMTGFRLARGGASERYGVTGDLVTLGKILGGGLPVGGYGGRAEIMDQVAPAGPVYQAGTLSGNPLATAAGCAMLDLVDESGVYERLEALGAHLESGMKGLIQKKGYPLTFQRVGSMFCLYFSSTPVKNYEDAAASDTEAFGRFFHGMLRRGVYLAPSAYESGFISLAHSESDLDQVLEAGAASLEEALGA